MKEFKCPKCECIISERCVKPDPCIGYLPGVFNACCGHGDDKTAYISFGFTKETCVNVRGRKALKIMQAMRESLGNQSDKSWHKAFEEAINQAINSL